MNARPIFAAAVAALAVLVACSQDAPTGPETNTLSTAAGGMPGVPGAARDRLFFKVKLEPLGESRAVGVLLLDVVGGYLRVRVHANGVEPGQHIPQHIHVNPGCNPGGGILINLDATLAVAGEAPGTGAAYPEASASGVVNYEATRSLADLRAAVNTWFAQALQNDAQLLEFLDLENRNAHMHVAFGPPFPAVNCGEMERIN